MLLDDTTVCSLYWSNAEPSKSVFLWTYPYTLFERGMAVLVECSAKSALMTLLGFKRGIVECE